MERRLEFYIQFLYPLNNLTAQNCRFWKKMLALKMENRKVLREMLSDNATGRNYY